MRLSVRLWRRAWRTIGAAMHPRVDICEIEWGKMRQMDGKLKSVADLFASDGPGHRQDAETLMGQSTHMPSSLFTFVSMAAFGTVEICSRAAWRVHTIAASSKAMTHPTLR